MMSSKRGINNNNNDDDDDDDDEDVHDDDEQPPSEAKRERLLTNEEEEEEEQGKGTTGRSDKKKARKDDDDEEEEEEDDNRNLNVPYYDRNTNFWFWNHPTLGQFFLDEPDYHPPKWEENAIPPTQDGNKPAATTTTTTQITPPPNIQFYINNSYLKRTDYNYTVSVPPIPSQLLIDRAISLRTTTSVPDDRLDELQKQITNAMWNQKKTLMWQNVLPSTIEELSSIIHIGSILFFEEGSFGWQSCEKSGDDDDENENQQKKKTPSFWIDLKDVPFEEEHGVGISFSSNHDGEAGTAIILTEEQPVVIEDIGYSYLASY